MTLNQDMVGILRVPTGTIEYYPDSVIKRLDSYDENVSQEWLDHYQAIQANNRYLIEVRRIVEPGIAYEMERLDVLMDAATLFNIEANKGKVKRRIVREIYDAAHSVWIDAIDYSHRLPNAAYGQYFMHGDIALKNMLITHNWQVKLGDAESFHFMDRLKNGERYALFHVDYMFNLQRHFRDAEHERYV